MNTHTLRHLQDVVALAEATPLQIDDDILEIMKNHLKTEDRLADEVAEFEQFGNLKLQEIAALETELDELRERLG